MIHLRSDWTKARAADAHPVAPGSIDGAALHWNGPPVPISALTDPRVFLEGVRRYHTKTRGWSDIAYNLAVDQTGDVWELRGLDHYSGANGTSYLNQRYIAVLFIIGDGQVPSDDMIAGGRRAIELIQKKYPRAGRIVGHGSIRPGGTACPGPHINEAIRSGAFSQKEDDDVTKEEVVEALLGELRDVDSPLARNLRNNIRLAVQAELKDEREGRNQ